LSVTGTLAIYRRELAGLFLAPLAWILFTLALIFNAVFFLLLLERETGGEVNRALSLLLGGGLQFWILMAILPPLLTMRMVSEESRSGILEFLLTAPVSDGAVIVGKALAATTFLSLLWASVLIYGALAHGLGAPPDWGQLVVQWVGASFVCALFSAIGLVASAASGTPLVAAFLAVVTSCLVIFGPLAGRTMRNDAAKWAIEKVDVMSHFQGSFQTGAIDTAHVVFFVAWILALLFIAVRLIESKRWMA
jgi:ABC-2 type transport system permease protein